MKYQFDYFYKYLHSLKITISLVGISEMWITYNSANLYDIPGYKFLIHVISILPIVCIEHIPVVLG